MKQERKLIVVKKGIAVLHDPYLNKGTAFTKEERKKYGLNGLLPSKIQTLEELATQTYEHYQTKSSDFEKRQFLMEIFNTNRALFYYLMKQHLVEFMPIVYDPVIADSIENYDHVFVQPQDAAFLSIDEPEMIRENLKNAADGRDIRLIVVTDAEAILGIGDWGVNGVDIAIGKLMVYTAAAQIDPNEVLAVSLDVGTNNEKLLNDPMYLGNRHARVYGEKYHQMVDEFVKNAHDLFPNALLHFEDFGRANADDILKRYQDQLPVFNDDIQGTGIICLAGILGGLNISKEKLADQKFLIFGAGTAGCGVAQMLCNELIREGLNENEAKQRIYLVDKQGLLFEDTADLTTAQAKFTRKHSEFEEQRLVDLLEIVKAIHPSVMIGTSKQPGAFSEAVVKEMAAHVERPIIFPISNPTKLLEAKAADLIKWTDGRALVATGIPSSPVEYKEVTYMIGQANNALVYPGVGLGTIEAKANVVNDSMLAAAAHALGGIVDVDVPGAPVLPPIDQLPTFTKKVAQAVSRTYKDQIK